VDVVVECLGGLEPARSSIAAALSAGRDVVTANKLVLAMHGAELRELARAHGGRLLGSAAVGGSAPVLERLGACNGSLRGVRGVLSGTVNFVLERLAEGGRVEDALAKARGLGLTESDATRDLDGSDAADKLRVIAGWLGIERLVIEREMLDEGVVRRARAAGKGGGRVRQVAELSVGAEGASARVRFAELAAGDPLFDLPDASNAAVLLGCAGPLAHAAGTGAGRWPTAESIVGDLLELARGATAPEELVAAARFEPCGE
jgi:homoserine dehydrogenase